MYICLRQKETSSCLNKKCIKTHNLSLCAVSISNTWNVGDKQGVTRCRREFGGFSADILIFRLSKLRYITPHSFLEVPRYKFHPSDWLS